MKSKLKFRVKWKTSKGEGIEEQNSGFMVDQQGTMYFHDSTRPLQYVSTDDYQECEPLIKIGDEWLSVDEIEKRLLFVEATEKSVAPWKCPDCGHENPIGTDNCLLCFFSEDGE